MGIARACALVQIVASKRAGRLGISCVDHPDAIGAVCSALIEGSVAYRAGLNVGDVITAVNGTLVSGHRECVVAIDSAPDRVAFVLSRKPRPTARATPESPPLTFPLSLSKNFNTSLTN